MKVINEMKLQFLSLSENEAFARSAVCSFAARLDPTVSELGDIRTAVSEAVTNCVVHAYKNKIGIIEIHSKIYDNRELYIKVKDKGCGIEDIALARTPLFTTAQAEERAGLGFAVMESFSDKLNVKSVVGKGTIVTMRKRLSGKD
jgi:stage II sporulation protein AB (anti-sigma F factor)